MSRFSNIQPLIDLFKEIKVHHKDYMSKSWTHYTTGFDFGVKEAQAQMKEIYKNPKKFELVKSFQDKDLSFEEKRSVELIYQQFEPYHLSKELNELNDEMDTLRTKLSGVLNSHRCKLDGKEVSSVELYKIMGTNPDTKTREKAWRARSQVNKPLVDAGFIELVNMRKEYAKLYGSKDYVEACLKHSELSPELFSDWEEQLKTELPNIINKEKELANKYLKQEKLNPWDSSYIQSQMCPYLDAEVDTANFFKYTADLYEKFGFDLHKQNITFDVFPRKNKSEWGYNFTIDLGKDSRILANINNQYCKFNVLLHEAGHANHFNNVDPEDQILNWGISGIISEGIANLFGGMTNEEIFFTQFFPEDDAKEKFADLRAWNKSSALMRIDRILFDQAIFRTELSSLDDINQLRLKFMRELGGCEDFTGEPPWAFLIHHTTHPIYLHNYFMGDVTCEMLKQVFCKRAGINSIYEQTQGFGMFLKEEVILASGRYPFEDLFNKISGEDFSLRYLTE